MSMPERKQVKIKGFIADHIKKNGYPLFKGRRNTLNNYYKLKN